MISMSRIGLGFGWEEERVGEEGRKVVMDTT